MALASAKIIAIHRFLNPPRCNRLSFDFSQSCVVHGRMGGKRIAFDSTIRHVQIFFVTQITTSKHQRCLDFVFSRSHASFFWRIHHGQRLGSRTRSQIVSNSYHHTLPLSTNTGNL